MARTRGSVLHRRERQLTAPRRELPRAGTHREETAQALGHAPAAEAETSAFQLQSAAFSVMMDLHGIPCGSLSENSRRLAFNQRPELSVYIAPLRGAL